MQRMLLTLLDGTTVFVRPIAPEDKPLLVDGLRALSPETAFRRFLSPKVRFSAAELRYLTEVDGHDHIALVAVDAATRLCRASPAACAPTPDTADMAIVVGDPWQGLGLGRRLARLLADAAAAEGVTRFAGTMLADNRPALRLMQGFGDGLRARRDLARRARDRHTSGRLTALAQARPGGTPMPGWSEPPSLYQRAARRRPRRATRRSSSARSTTRAGPSARVPVQGTEALVGRAAAARLARRPLRRRRRRRPCPSRKALALVRLADPHLPFIAVSPHMRAGDSPRSCAGCPTASRASPTSRSCPAVLTRELEQARMRRRVGGAHRLLGRPAGDRRPPRRRASSPAPCASACSPRSATSLGWTFGAVWRPDGAAPALRHAWHAAGARAAGRRAGQRHARADLRRRPGPRRAACGPSAARLARATSRRGACAPAWSPPPRSRSRSATSASA